MAIPHPREAAFAAVHARAQRATADTSIQYRLDETKPDKTGERWVVAVNSTTNEPLTDTGFRGEPQIVREPYRLCSHLYGRFDHPTDPSKSDPPGQYNVYA